MLRGGLTAQHVPAGEAVSWRASGQHALTAFLPAPRAAGTPGGGPPGLPGSRRPLVSVVLSEVPPPCASLGRPGRPPCPPRLWPQGLSRAEFTFSAGRGLTNPYKTQGQRPRAKAEGLSWLLELLAVDSVGRARRTVGAPHRVRTHTESHAAISPEGAACPGRGSESALSRELGCRPPRVPSARDGGAGDSGQRGARGEGRGAWGPTAQAVLTLRAAGRAGERPSLCGATFRCARPRGTGGSVGCRESHPGPSWGSDSGRRDPEPLPFGALRRLLGVLVWDGPQRR